MVASIAVLARPRVDVVSRPRSVASDCTEASVCRRAAVLLAMSLLAVGRKYGVSDNAVRKWIRWYEYQRELEQPQGEAA